MPTENPTILVVEDDAAIRRGVVDTLAGAGYDVIDAADGRAGMERALNATYDLLLLDLVLPHHDGFEILERLQADRPGVPVIVLSARGQEDDRVRGLGLGADDYVVKPFSVRELIARVQAVLRRSPERPNEIEEVAFPGGVADLAKSEVRFEEDDARESLSEREVELLPLPRPPLRSRRLPRRAPPPRLAHRPHQHRDPHRRHARRPSPHKTSG